MTRWVKGGEVAHASPSGVGRLVISSLVITFTVATASPIAAQEASPIASPTATACTVEPRSVDELVAVFFDPQGTPIATQEPLSNVDAEAELPQGEPADAETVAAVEVVVQELVACLDTEQLPNAFTLMTDDLIRQLTTSMGGLDIDTAEELRTLLEEQRALPVTAEGEGTEVSQGRDVRVLEEGRVGGIWTIAGDAGFNVLTQEDGRWLVDEIIDILGDD